MIERRQRYEKAMELKSEIVKKIDGMNYTIDKKMSMVSFVGAALIAQALPVMSDQEIYLSHICDMVRAINKDMKRGMQ